MPPPIASLYTRYCTCDLAVDSRRVTVPERTLFFALPGQRTDGHDFIGELYAAGVRAFVINRRARPRVQKQGEEAGEEDGWTHRYPEADFISVADPLRTLQDLAAHHRRQFPALPVVAITGSNGKTIVKDWLAQLLGVRYHVCASPRSYNSQIGVPLSVWRLRAEHQVAVFEAGVSRSGEMERLAAIIQPNAGVFTMLGSAHDDGFPDREAKLREKLSLFRGADWVAVCADDTDAVRELRKNGVEVRTFLGVNARILEVEEHPLRLSFPDLPPVYLENAYTAAATAYFLGVSEQQLFRQIPALQMLTNRLEQREGRDGGVVINDTYSNDLSALAAALNFAVAQNPFPNLTLIIGEFPFVAHQDRLPAEEVSRRMQELLHLLGGQRIDDLIIVGRRPPGMGRYDHFATPELLLEALEGPRGAEFGNRTTLVKGASYQRLDRVADVLSRKQHQTLLRLDLTALRHNFQVYRNQTTAKVMAMVKASAYGGGALPVARALAAAGADHLAVAYPDEGVLLREGGVRLPIMVLNAGPDSYARCAASQLEPVVHDYPQLYRAKAAGLRVHLEIDTGMARLGFPPRRIDTLVTVLGQDDFSGTIASVFTHLAAADDPAHDDFTRQQLADFDAAYAKISGQLTTPPFRHVLNTSGIGRFSQHAYDYVRLGIGMYGIGDSLLRTQLRPALSLLTTVTRVYQRPAGESVGYGRRGRLGRDSRVAVLPIGYADGLPRLVGEGRFSVRIGEHLAPIVGSVCMDMTMVDVTDLPGVAAGTEVTVFGPEHPIELLAEAAQTIPYEILTGIGNRVHRVYTEE